MHLNIFGITSKRNILCIYPKEGQEKENKEDEERKRTTKTTTRCRKIMKIKNTKDGRNKSAISVIKESINGLTFTIKKTVNLDFSVLKTNYICSQKTYKI